MNTSTLRRLFSTREIVALGLLYTCAIVAVLYGGTKLILAVHAAEKAAAVPRRHHYKIVSKDMPNWWAGETVQWDSDNRAVSISCNYQIAKCFVLIELQ